MKKVALNLKKTNRTTLKPRTSLFRVVKRRLAVRVARPFKSRTASALTRSQKRLKRTRFGFLARMDRLQPHGKMVRSESPDKQLPRNQTPMVWRAPQSSPVAGYQAHVISRRSANSTDIEPTYLIRAHAGKSRQVSGGHAISKVEHGTGGPESEGVIAPAPEGSGSSENLGRMGRGTSETVLSRPRVRSTVQEIPFEKPVQSKGEQAKLSDSSQDSPEKFTGDLAGDSLTSMANPAVAQPIPENLAEERFAGRQSMGVGKPKLVSARRQSRVVSRNLANTRPQSRKKDLNYSSGVAGRVIRRAASHIQRLRSRLAQPLSVSEPAAKPFIERPSRPMPENDIASDGSGGEQGRSRLPTFSEDRRGQSADAPILSSPAAKPMRKPPIGLKQTLATKFKSLRRSVPPRIQRRANNAARSFPYSGTPAASASIDVPSPGQESGNMPSEELVTSELQASDSPPNSIEIIPHESLQKLVRSRQIDPPTSRPTERPTHKISESSIQRLPYVSAQIVEDGSAPSPDVHATTWDGTHPYAPVIDSSIQRTPQSILPISAGSEPGPVAPTPEHTDAMLPLDTQAIQAAPDTIGSSQSPNSASESQVNQGAELQDENAEGQNMDQLAREVYQILRRRLRIEEERSYGWMG